MTDSIAITGVTANLRVPGVFVEVNSAAGPAGGTASDRPTVIVAKKLASGTYTANQLVWPQDETAVNAGCGYRSDAAIGWRKARAANNTQRIGIIPYAETSGATPVAASTTITVGDTTATGTTVWTLGVADTDNSVLIQSGDAPEDIAGFMRSKLAGNAFVVESGSSASVVISAPHVGTCGGVAGYKPIKVTTNAPGMGVTITGASDVGTTTPGVEGSTTEAANFAAALAANSGVWIYNIIADVGNNATALASLDAFLATQAEPLNGKRGTAIVAYNRAISGGTTLAQACNYERLSFVNGVCVRNTPMEIAANIGAIFAKREASDRTYPFAGYSLPDLLLTPVADTTVYPDQLDQNDAILGGQMPLAVSPSGKVYIVDATTTRVLDSTGAYTDFRAYKRHRISGADDAGDKVQTVLALNMTGKKLSSDPVDSAGNPVYTNVVPPKVVYPRTLKKYVEKVLRDQETSGQAQDAAATIASLVMARSTDNVERVLCSFNYRTIDHATQAAVQLNEVTPG